MRAWAVAVLTEHPTDGMYLTSIFTVARTQGEAMAQGVRHAIDITGEKRTLVRLRCAQTTEIGVDLVLAAAESLREPA
jgi:hypothetical protein